MSKARHRQHISQADIERMEAAEELLLNAETFQDFRKEDPDQHPTDERQNTPTL